MARDGFLPRSSERRRTTLTVIVITALVGVTVGTLGLASARQQMPAAGGVSAPAAAPQPPTADPVIAVTGLSAAAGSLVGGEQQTITGSGLKAVSAIRIGSMLVADFIATDTSLTFEMPRSERYLPGAVPVEIVASEATIDMASPLEYTYERRTAVDRQLEYAFRYWKDYNLAEWGTFNPVGGDCMNFVSQTLIERGWEMTPEWHSYDVGADYTSPWIYVPSFDAFLRDNPQLGAVQLGLDQRDQAKVGDLVVFDWNNNNALDHIQIVSAIEQVDGRTVVKMVGHNLDSDLRDLDETITVDHPGATGYFWSLPAD
ncbi:hypothetical protein GCM10009792_18940 [Microcella alkalica]|uniref:CHAP domain-containing protein n=1 Tax=Microcella alkalica TaxID=355930 RepID=A0A839EC27_9MICO|nr:amidase domain-containing protein [Microcella alkalica]MBA8848683.1 hypothetical protein [Microcella alkalica]